MVRNTRSITKMKHYINTTLQALLFILFSSSFLISAGCAPQEQINSLDRRVNGLSVENGTQAREISELKKQIAALQQETGGHDSQDMEQLRSSVADAAGRIEQLQAELMRLNGQLEQLAISNEKQKEELKKLREEQKTEIEKLRQEVRLLQKSTGVTRRVEESREKAARGEIDLYQEALDLFKAKKFKQAKKALKKYIDTNPNGDMLDNAHFWIGECEYNLKRYEEAILEYQVVISKFPKSNKIPDALLKQGLSFAKLGDIESAKIVLSKLVKKYPSSPQAKVGRKQLSRLP